MQSKHTINTLTYPNDKNYCDNPARTFLPMFVIQISSKSTVLTQDLQSLLTVICISQPFTYPICSIRCRSVATMQKKYVNWNHLQKNVFIIANSCNSLYYLSYSASVRQCILGRSSKPFKSRWTACSLLQIQVILSLECCRIRARLSSSNFKSWICKNKIRASLTFYAVQKIQRYSFLILYKQCQNIKWLRVLKIREDEINCHSLIYGPVPLSLYMQWEFKPSKTYVHLFEICR